MDGDLAARATRPTLDVSVEGNFWEVATPPSAANSAAVRRVARGRVGTCLYS